MLHYTNKKSIIERLNKAGFCTAISFILFIASVFVPGGWAVYYLIGSMWASAFSLGYRLKAAGEFVDKVSERYSYTP